MNVASIVTRKMITVGMADSLKKVRALLMKHAAFNHILVVEDRKLVGVISDRDLLTGDDRGIIDLNKKAHEIMIRIPVTVDVEISIEKASNLLLENNISCIPVLSSQGAIEGIVTWKDVIKFYLKNKNCH
jgi:acetoin utilization protein AcuB